MVFDKYSPQSSAFYFFDPSSIEVELNPDLFPASQVEWTQVEAYCVSHADNGVRGTDNFRKAFGLKPRYDEEYFRYSRKYIENHSQMDFNDLQNVYDFLHYSNDKWGMTYPVVVSTPKYSGGTENNGYYDDVVGRGKAGSVALEPMVLKDWRNDVERYTIRIPGVEVMVYLKVKVKGQSEPFIYVRHYLPEIQLLDLNKVADMNKVWQNLKSRQPKGTGINRQSPTYDYEMMRIGKILNYLNSDFKNN